MKAVIALVMLVLFVAGALSATASAQGKTQRPLAGRSLAAVLRELQARGVRVVFSSELVRPKMRVESEPVGAEHRQLLAALLGPHGLEVRPGPGATLVVVRAAARARHAQSPTAGAIIRGVVVDARTATPLAGVLVRLADATTTELVTDAEGRFVLSGVPAGRQTLFASRVGYSLARPLIDVTAGGTYELTVALADGTATYTEELTVTGDLFRASEHTVASAITVTSADLLELRGVLTEDPLRAMHALPSVTSGNDFRSEFSVRGSDYRHIGLSVDGMPTDWPVHAVRDDASAGSVSLINADTLDHVTLFSGAYPQERPARTGAWVDFSLREGSRARLQARGGLSMTSASLVLEGPVGQSRRGSWLMATRQSYAQWILRRMGSNDTTTFGFTDIQGKGVYDVSPTQRFDVTVLAGRSQLDLRRRDGDPNLVGRGLADTLLVTTGWRTTHGSSVTIDHRASTSRYGFANRRIDGRALADGGGNSVAYRGAVSWMFRPSTTVKAGSHVQRDSTDQSATRFIERPPVEQPLPRQQSVLGSRVLWSADLRVTHASHGGHGLDSGVLISSATDDPSRPAPSPWFAAAASIGRGFTVRTAGGVYRQHPALDQTTGTFGRQDVRAERATQIEVALEHRWRPDTRVQLTAYSRRERDMLQLTDNEYRLVSGAIVPPTLNPYWQNVLDGTSTGIELVAQRRAASGLSGWIAYGLSRVRYENGLTGERFFADFDQRHAFSAYAQYRVSAVTSLSGKLRVGSNFPIPGYLQGPRGMLAVGESRNTVRLPSYARLDLRANRAFNFDARRLTLFVEVVNVLGRSNLAPGYDAMRLDPAGRVIASTQGLFPFLPTAGILVEF